MNDKFVIDIDRNDNLVEFVRCFQSLRSSPIPELSLPILDKNYELHRLLRPEKLKLAKYQIDHKKVRFLNKCLQVPPLNPEKCNKKLTFRYSSRQPTRHTQINVPEKKKNVIHSSREFSSINNINYGQKNKNITPLRERVCLACRKNSLLRDNFQEKNKYTERRLNESQDYLNAVLHDKSLTAIDEFIQHSKTKNFKTLSNLSRIPEKDREIRDTLYEIIENPKSVKFNDFLSSDQNLTSQIEETRQKMSFFFNNREISNELYSNDELHSRHYRKNFLQLLNTDPINSNNNTCFSQSFSIERLSI